MRTEASLNPASFPLRCNHAICCSSSRISTRLPCHCASCLFPIHALYRYSVLLSVILCTPGRELSGKAGTCTRGVRICTPQHAMLTNISSTPQVRWCSVTHTQSLPRHRLPLMPAQHVRSHVPSRHARTLREMTHDACITRRICCFCWSRLGGCHT